MSLGIRQVDISFIYFFDQQICNSSATAAFQKSFAESVRYQFFGRKTTLKNVLITFRTINISTRLFACCYSHGRISEPPCSFQLQSERALVNHRQHGSQSLRHDLKCIPIEWHLNTSFTRMQATVWPTNRSTTHDVTQWRSWRSDVIMMRDWPPRCNVRGRRRPPKVTSRSDEENGFHCSRPRYYIVTSRERSAYWRCKTEFPPGSAWNVQPMEKRISLPKVRFCRAAMLLCFYELKTRLIDVAVSVDMCHFTVWSRNEH